MYAARALPTCGGELQLAERMKGGKEGVEGGKREAGGWKRLCGVIFVSKGSMGLQREIGE